MTTLPRAGKFYGTEISSLVHNCNIKSVDQLKGREPEWTNLKSSTGNCMNCAKMQEKTCIPYEYVVRNFKFLNVQQLLKCILRVFPYLGGLTQHLWVSPLWFSALQFRSASACDYVKPT